MNLMNFLSQTDAIASKYSAEQLSAFIHDIGRVLPEQNRDDFLIRLKAAGAMTDQGSIKDIQSDQGFNEKYKLVRSNLKKIDSHKLAINAILNEEYDEWYSDSGEEYYYKDNNGITDMLAEACDFVHTCMDMGKYIEGLKIGNQLFTMEILCTSEYEEFEFYLKDLVHYRLLDWNLMQVCLNTAYCAYHAVPLKKRPETLYEVLVNGKIDEITLEKIMQHGDKELPDFQEFLTNWLSYLGTKTERNADRLISEGIGLLDDLSAAAGYAEKYVAQHPGLYLNILENGKNTDANDMISIGIAAMKIIPKKYVMRSRTALKTADYIIEANKNLSLLQKCYFVAYESDTSALNYLRALLNGYEKKRDKLQEIFIKLPVQSSHSYGMYEAGSTYSERKENRPDDNMILILRFLDGQFADVLADGLNKSEPLGWSGTFMKQGIALYLLYLYEGHWSGKGISAMADIVKKAMNFSAEAYQKGTYRQHEINENDLFCEVFTKWRSMTEMEPDIRTSAVDKIAGLLVRRTEGIMNANRRNYYGECAAYIAALGEVRESMGDTGAKQRLMTAYKDTYPRRSAFHEELGNYGWKNAKKL